MDSNPSIGWRWMRRAIVAVLALGVLTTGDFKQRFARLKPVTFDLSNGAGPVPLMNDNRAPSDVKHWGLKGDRGLPLLTHPGAAPGDQWVVGAPPKAYRFTYLTASGLAYSNYFPTWLPTELYSTGIWYYIEDWRLHIWPSSGDSTTARLEISNGLLSIDCYASSARPNRDYVCPDDPELAVKNDVSGLAVRVTHPDTSEQVFEREGTATTTAGGRFALQRVTKMGTGNTKQLVREYIRKPLTPQGVPAANPDPKYRISKILNWGPGANGSADGSYSVTWLYWRDTNKQTNDCKPNPDVTGQCNNGTWYCYDRKCENVERENASDAPPDGDWKLSRIVMPQPVSPSSQRPLIYTILYEGRWYENSKYISTIEDNRGPPEYRQFAPVGINSGNATQFGYDMLLTTRGLKAVSHEHGYDRTTQKFEFTNYGVLQRVWTDRYDPYLFRYEDLGGSKTRLTQWDPFGVPTQLELEPVGDRTPDPQNPCDATDGCNIQLGVTKVASGEGGVVQNEYYLAGSGEATGELKSTTEADGTVTSWIRDQAQYGRITRETSECIERTFDYGSATFMRTPTTVTTSIDGMQVSSETKTICDSSESTCPPYEYGQSKTSTTTFANRPNSALTVTATFAGNSKSVTTSDGTVSMLTGRIADRDPMFGTPRALEVPGASLQGGSTPDQALAPGAASPNCDATQGDCSGTTAVANNVTTQTTAYWPADLGSRPELSAALGAMGVAAPTAAAMVTVAANTTSGNDTRRSANSSDPGITTNVQVVYDPFTHNPKTTTTTINDVAIVEAVDYAKVAYPAPANGGADVILSDRSHPTAVVKQTKTVAGALVRGEFADYPTDEDGIVTETRFGPTARGHLRADGSRAPADWKIEEDSHNPPQFAVGCPMLRTPILTYQSPCFTDLDCRCGRCSADPQTFRPGVCMNTGPELPSDFVCRKTYLGDPNLTQQRFWASYTRIHNYSWYMEQCQTPACLAASRLFCTNPQ